MDEYIEVDITQSDELTTATEEPTPLPDTKAYQTDVVLFIVLCLGIIFGGILGKAFMQQWKVGV